MSDRPATIGERAVTAFLLHDIVKRFDPVAYAESIDALIAEHVAAITKDRDHWKANHDIQVTIKNRLSDRYGEFRQWAFSQCNANCGPYRNAGRHAPNCPVADLMLEAKGKE